MGYDFIFFDKELYLSYGFSKFSNYWCPKHSLDKETAEDALENLNNALQKLKEDGFVPEKTNDIYETTGNTFAYQLQMFKNILEEEIGMDVMRYAAKLRGPEDCSCRGKCELKNYDYIDEEEEYELKMKLQREKEEEEEFSDCDYESNRVN